MKHYALLFLTCAACSGGLETFPVDASHDTGDVKDALLGHNDRDICCVLTKTEVDSSLWGLGTTYDCYADTSLYSSVPWICFTPDASSCDDPNCVVGGSCLGANGTGKVIPCYTNGE